jgi:hypothetical protein
MSVERHKNVAQQMRQKFHSIYIHSSSLSFSLHEKAENVSRSSFQIQLVAMPAKTSETESLGLSLKILSLFSKRDIDGSR